MNNFENQNDEVLNSSDENFELAEENHEEDYSNLSKKELLNLLDDFKIADHDKPLNILRNIKEAYDQLLSEETQIALDKFIEDGGEKDDFELKKDEDSLAFEKKFFNKKSELDHILTQLENQKEENLKKKQALLEQIRSLTEGELNNETFSQFKQIEEDWKTIGHVPFNYSQEIYNSYRALRDIFYNNKNIYFELLDLDRKKNLEKKKEVVKKVKALESEKSIAVINRELRQLHDEYKHIGPIPKEVSDELWNEMRSATDKVNEQRKALFEQLNQQRDANYEAKLNLINQLDEFVNFSSGKIDDWKQKNIELTAIQEQWKKTGPVPEEKAKEITGKFWENCKQFYKIKNDFFNEIDKKRKANLVKKQELIELIENISQEEDIQSVANQIKDIQRRWDKIGQVPFKNKDKLNKKFKDLCDAFFEKKRQKIEEDEKAFLVNYEAKKSICSDLESFINANTPDALTKEVLQNYRNEWNEKGFVPRDFIKDSTDSFTKVQNAFIEKSTAIPDEEKANFILTLEVESLKSSRDGLQTLRKKEQAVYKKIREINDEIITYKNNIEFFVNSKNASSIISDIEQKISVLENQLDRLKVEEKIIKS